MMPNLKNLRDIMYLQQLILLDTQKLLREVKQENEQMKERITQLTKPSVQ